MSPLGTVRAKIGSRLTTENMPRWIERLVVNVSLKDTVNSFVLVKLEGRISKKGLDMSLRRRLRLVMMEMRVILTTWESIYSNTFDFGTISRQKLTYRVVICL